MTLPLSRADLSSACVGVFEISNVGKSLSFASASGDAKQGNAKGENEFVAGKELAVSARPGVWEQRRAPCVIERESCATNPPDIRCSFRALCFCVDLPSL